MVARMVRGWFAVLTVVTAAALAASCSVTPGSSRGPASAPAAPATVGVTETGPVTLTVWDQESGQVSKVWDQLNAEFQQKYPNVTIKRVRRSLGDLKTSLKLAISGPNPPDVVEANQGWPDMGQMVKAGLLLPLDNYAKAYGWSTRVSANVNAVSSFTPDGKQFGTGSLFGFTDKGELIGVFYNKTKLEKLGLAVPTTFAEFEQALAIAKQSGEVPIAFGNLDRFGGIHEFAAVQDRIAPVSYLTDFIFGRQGANLSFDTAQNLQAAGILQDWARKGYFTAGFNGVGYDNTLAKFVKGEGVFMITGNWIVADLGQNSTDFGFILMPPMQAGDPPVTTGGPGFPLAITAATKHPDAAAAYIDWMTNSHSDELLLPTGQIPLAKGADTSSVSPDTLLGQVRTAADATNRANGLVPYEDWATPTMYDTMSAAVQELMGMQITPQQFVDKNQKDYAAFQKSRP
jgi:raffinose/stachyose/melibiose transport system substrate-binding protein